MTPDLITRWREEAEQLRRWGADPQASTLEHAAEELQAWLQERDLEELTVAQVAERIGLAESTVRRRVRAGRLQNVARPGKEVRIRAGDAIPGRRSLTTSERHPDVADLVSRRQRRAG